MTISIETFPLGPLQTNAHLLTVDGQCCLVDAPPLPDRLLRRLGELGLAPSAVLLTHGHGDHIGGLGDIRQAFPQARVLCPAGEATMLTDAQANLSLAFGLPITAGPADELIQPGQTLTLAGTQVHVLDTSGHSPAGVSFYCPAAEAVFTGDALFAGSVGRADIPGADFDRLIANIRKNLLPLPPQTRVLPGHGRETTIGRETDQNPFL